MRFIEFVVVVVLVLLLLSHANFIKHENYNLKSIFKSVMIHSRVCHTRRLLVAVVNYRARSMNFKRIKEEGEKIGHSHTQ